MLLKNGMNPKLSCEVVSVIDYSLRLNVKESMHNWGNVVQDEMIKILLSYKLCYFNLNVFYKSDILFLISKICSFIFIIVVL